MAVSKLKKWSTARRHSFIVSVLRAGTRRWPPKYTVMHEAKTIKKTNQKTGRLAQHFRCANCDGEFPSSYVQCDHITPVVEPGKGFENWDTYISRLFCEAEGFQCLCTDCHAVKTALEKGERNLRKKDISK